MFNEKKLLWDIVKSALVAVIAILGAIIFVSILSRQISKISNSVFEKQTVALILEKRTENLFILKQELEQIGNVDARIENAFPAPDSILEFVVVLESLASQRSLTQNIGFGNIVPSPINSPYVPLSLVDYNVSFGGNINILQNYLEDFEKLPFFTGIKTLTFYSSDATGWIGNSQIVIGANLYIKSP